VGEESVALAVASAVAGVGVAVLPIKTVAVDTGVDGRAATGVAGSGVRVGRREATDVAVGCGLAASGTRKIRKRNTRIAAVATAQASQLPVVNSVASC
jgi:hypothetical protein